MSRGAWDAMLADEHARGQHSDGCACSSAEPVRSSSQAGLASIRGGLSRVANKPTEQEQP